MPQQCGLPHYLLIGMWTGQFYPADYDSSTQMQKGGCHTLHATIFVHPRWSPCSHPHSPPSPFDDWLQNSNVACIQSVFFVGVVVDPVCLLGFGEDISTSATPTDSSARDA